ncbi:restriction endonuclease [Sphaerotilus sp.]|uniref:restriction endonuclease n=1 Tax=Sphaerotilus sp. TaxID=2093942 RepID=UPI002ACD8E5C|nr:restriction endonuclease [Sphaerotilus sp.]MDZ7854844.1 restriction endonuclease [Sphaerotilus sp.]
MSAAPPTPSIPTYDRFIEPLLRCLARWPEGVAAREAHEAAADALGLDALARQQLLSSGAQLIYKNRAGWAHDRLKRAGLSDSPRRGWWQLTEAGRRFVVEHAGPLSAEQVAALAMSHLEARLRPVAAEAGDDAAVVQSVASPEERLGLALEEIRRAVVAELLDTLASVTPAFFETLVLDLLHRMGYGANRADLQRVGGSGDGGIDGIISLDRLGLEKVYVQAKRWQGTVGRPEIQAFYGALAGQRAKKGVFITTSSYTAQATQFAQSVEGIVLVDGVRLAELMVDHEVGVTARVLKVPKVDVDYFDE